MASQKRWLGSNVIARVAELNVVWGGHPVERATHICTDKSDKDKIHSFPHFQHRSHPRVALERVNELRVSKRVASYSSKIGRANFHSQLAAVLADSPASSEWLRVERSHERVTRGRVTRCELLAGVNNP